MQPDNQQYSIDYLNSISSTPPPKTIKPIFLWLMIGGVLAVVAIVVMMVLSLGSSSKENLTTLATRMSTLETITGDAQENIQSSDLRTFNSSLSLVLTNANRDIVTVTTVPDEKSKEYLAVSAESAKITAALEDARLNAVYDRAYTRELTYFLKDLRTQMNVLYQGTNDKALRTYLEKTDANIKPLAESIAAFNAD